MEEYVGRFESEFSVSINFSVQFEELPEGQAGVCTKWSNGAKQIKIKKSYFDAVNDYQREQLIYHELGHCVLNRDHNNNLITFVSDAGNWPASIMRSVAFSTTEADVYKTNRSYYLDELN
jgi:hypothetical protein